jgi:serine/threonine protein kinase
MAAVGIRVALRGLMTIAWALQPPDAFLADLPERLGRFDVVGSIAEGGMGTVWRGQDRLTGELVALKTVRGDRRADAASIRREIVALEQLSHPGIVRLLDHGTWNDKPWMALELLDGRTVCDVIALLWRKAPEGLLRARRVGPRAVRTGQHVAAAGRLRDALGIATNLCAALDYIHTLGLVHRDVKPSNVFLGGDGRVTLLDFGLVCPARGIAGSDASADSCVGTMEYAAPEQIRGEPVDARADVYSLGCMVYELVTGTRPADAGTPDNLNSRPIAREPAAPSTLVSSVPRALDGLLLAMLASRPEDRPASAADVAAMLAEIPTAGPSACQPASENPTITAQTARIDAATITIP